jgi:hypothetical protein
MVIAMGSSLKNYQTGQIWKYRARDGEAESQLVIINSTLVPGCGEIYSVAVEGSLDLSVLELIGIRPSPLEEYGDAFQEWKQPFDRGEAGVFTIPIAEILTCVEEAVNHGTIIDNEDF